MSRPRRLTGFDYHGPHRYFLTFCVRARQRAFDDPIAAHLAIEHFSRTTTLCHFALLAYCVMPDHVHLLVEGQTRDADLRRLAKRLKQGSGQAYGHRFGRQLWQEGYYEHVLRRDEDARSVARYILGNPVRAGIAQHPAEYPYLGSGVWELKDPLGSIA